MYTLSKNVTLEALQLTRDITVDTTYANMPGIKADLGAFALGNGTLSILSTPASCSPGSAVAVRLSSRSGTSISWFESQAPNVGLVLNLY